MDRGDGRFGEQVGGMTALPGWTWRDDGPDERALERQKTVLPSREVHGELLRWVMHFVSEDLWTQLGTATTLAVLRSTHEELLRVYPDLSAFQVTPEARVELQGTPSQPYAGELLHATAAWVVRAVEKARQLAPGAYNVHVRKATFPMHEALERLGFYRAVEAAQGIRR